MTQTAAPTGSTPPTDTDTRTDDPDPDTPDTRSLPPAKAPVGTGPAPLVGQLVALGLVALGVVAAQDLLARTGILTQAPWTDGALGLLDGLAADSPAVLLTGVVAAVVGLLLIPVALRRRPRTTVELDAGTGVRLRTKDLPVLVRGALERLDGVTDVDVRARRRRLDVVVRTLGDDRRQSLEDDVRDRLAPTLQALEHAPRLRTTIKEGSS